MKAKYIIVRTVVSSTPSGVATTRTTSRVIECDDPSLCDDPNTSYTAYGVWRICRFPNHPSETPSP